MAMGLAFLTSAGVAAAVLFLANQVVVKTGLFLVAGIVEREQGTGSLDGSGGMLHQRPLVAALFAPLALSIAGIPPFGGFVPKLGLVQAGLEQVGQNRLATENTVAGILRWGFIGLAPVFRCRGIHVARGGLGGFEILARGQFPARHRRAGQRGQQQAADESPIHLASKLPPRARCRLMR